MEKRIKDSFDYEIKTTSNDILKKLEKPKRVYLARPFIFGYVSIFILVLALSFVLFRNKGGKEIKIDNTVLSKMSLQLFYGGELTGESSRSLKRLNTSEFERAKEEYNKVHNLVLDMFNSNGVIEYTYEAHDFTYNGVAYHYEFKVLEDSIYLIDELKNDDEVEALFYINGKYYSGILEFEVEDDETEIEMSYYDGEYLISIKRDYELDEYEVEYSVSLNGSEIEIYEIQVEIEDELVCEIEHKTLNKDVSFEIIKLEGYYEINYSERSYLFDFNITMKLEIIDNLKNFEILQ